MNQTSDQITENYMVVSGAYGRDYRSTAAAKADFLGGKDFVLNHYKGTTYCSVRDFKIGVTVNIRYNNARNVCSVTVS